MAPNPAATCQGGFSGICPGPNPIAQRNYPPHSFIETYFGNGSLPSLNLTGSLAFQRQLYLAVLSQAIEMKADIGTRRTNAHTGTIYWQGAKSYKRVKRDCFMMTSPCCLRSCAANEIWPTGGWGSLEYGTVGFTPGQVVGGRWKILHHWVSSILYKDAFFTCGVDGRCLVRNDSPVRPLGGTAIAQLLKLSNASTQTAAPVFVMSEPVNLGLGFGAVQQFCLGGGNWSTACEPLGSVVSRFGCSATGVDCVLLLEVDPSTGGLPAAASWELLAIPGAVAPSLPPAVVQAVVATNPNADRSVNVTVTSAGGLAALFVTLTTAAQGRFSDNAIIIPGSTGGSSYWAALGNSVTLRFIGFPVSADGSGADVDIGLLASSLRVEHLAQYV